ncbi:hypothetical protein B5P44_00105 [Mycobacterium sp. CBMA 213]|uniref:Lipoprotein n=1 Tax=Mycolicibacterium sp. CBMA 213 TaxID=1968788 RepID=A0A343VQZ5_9MYCO|nr:MULTISPECIES: hypothetical protein [unclassified Mycolicibacterium]AVN58319.1 hypothetical protein B5P44_p00024 [Mycolicibacterium sp. CBMA 213]MUL60987.1 hypothetical protein [Mycolicibacterium sp. CBMA 335]MUM03224.1 hypothetical protein [Mycolicibacterium sp. CBMA 213]
MKRFNMTVVATIGASVAIAGCASGAGGGAVQVRNAAGSSVESAAPAGQIAVGQGPTNYTVQTQPPAGSCQYRYSNTGEPLPDPRCTPGATNPKVTQDTLANTICRSGYTKSIRPPVEITRAEKRSNAQSYSFTGDLKSAEFDHLLSLELGGDPNDPKNLWVEPPSPGHKPRDGVNNDKDIIENKLASAVCNGRVPLADAQTAIATDWTTALDRLGLR